MNERRIRSRPARTMLDVLREQEKGKRLIGLETGFPGSSVGIGRLPPKEPGQRSLEQNPGAFNVEDHVFRKPTKERPNKPLIVPETERITWQVEQMEDYNGQGDLGLIVQFSGIEFITPVFERSRHDYGPDSRVFYSPVRYKNGQAFLILATYGDIFESQVVATIIDVRPFFGEETLLPQLTVTHNPTSMTVYEKNHLVVVSYDRL